MQTGLNLQTTTTSPINSSPVTWGFQQAMPVENNELGYLYLKTSVNFYEVI